MTQAADHPDSCRHSHAYALRGMKRVGISQDGEDILFACPTCGAEAIAARCLATNTRNGKRCRNAALAAPSYCRRHIRLSLEFAEAVVRIPRHSDHPFHGDPISRSTGFRSLPDEAATALT